MGPLLLVGGVLALTLLAPRKAAVPKGFVAVPIPPPNADGSPPKSARVPPGIGLFVDVRGITLDGTFVKPHGTPAPTTWEFQTGSFQGEGGGAPLPLLWVSPDRKFAAVLWTLDPATGAGDAGPPGGPFAKPGDVLMALVKA